VLLLEIIQGSGDMPQFAQFHNVSLDLALSEGARVKTTYRTQVIRMREADEDRIAEWQDPLRTFDVSPALRHQEDLNTLIAFYRARLGSFFGFKIKDPTDYSCSILEGYAAIADGVSTSFQLVKVYTTGLPGDTEYRVRPIQFPDEGVQIYFNGTLTSAPYTLDYLLGGGVVSFTTPPPVGTVMQWAGTFQVPVRFVTTKMYTSIAMYQQFETDILLQEQRLPLPVEAGVYIEPEHEPHDFEEVLFPPTFAMKSQIGPSFEAIVTESASGFDQQTLQFLAPRLCFSVDQNSLTFDEMTVLLKFFHVRRGKLGGFRAQDLTDYQAEDELFAYGDGLTTSFQLTKTYRSGGYFQIRQITKPIGNIIIKVGDTMTDFAVNYTTGIVTCNHGAPAGGAALFWTGEFHVPVRFNIDEINISVDGFRIQSWSDIELVEVSTTFPEITLDFSV
jgi:uncharacterized protein (TIGR02217 family)